MTNAVKPKRVVIMGAAGRDFHNFNVAYRDNPYYQVVAFTAAQIPGISGRRYPPALPANSTRTAFQFWRKKIWRRSAATKTCSR